MRGERPKVSPWSPLASAMSRAWLQSSAAFSRERLAAPQRQPSDRSGPSSARCARIRTATQALFAFFRATKQPASRTPGASASRKKSTKYGGTTRGRPAASCPGGTVKLPRAQASTAPAGSRGHGTPTEGSGSATATGWVSRAPPFAFRRRRYSRWYAASLDSIERFSLARLQQVSLRWCLRAGLSAQDPLDNYH